MRAELFNAGEEWAEQLARPAVAAFAVALGDLHESLPERLADADDPMAVLSDVVREATAASLAEGFTAALALAERAFASVLLHATQGRAEELSLAQSWEESRGASRDDLIAQYAGEVLRQFAMHALDRELGRAATNKLTDIASFREVSISITNAAATLGVEAAYEALRIAPERDAWASLIRDAFSKGREYAERQS